MNSILQLLFSLFSLQFFFSDEVVLCLFVCLFSPTYLDSKTSDSASVRIDKIALNHTAPWRVKSLLVIIKDIYKI